MTMKKPFAEGCKVKVITQEGIHFFENLEKAREKFPELDPDHNGKNFTWAMHDDGYMRFEDWKTNELLSH